MALRKTSFIFQLPLRKRRNKNGWYSLVIPTTELTAGGLWCTQLQTRQTHSYGPGQSIPSVPWPFRGSPHFLVPHSSENHWLPALENLMSSPAMLGPQPYSKHAEPLVPETVLSSSCQIPKTDHCLIDTVGSFVPRAWISPWPSILSDS